MMENRLNRLIDDLPTLQVAGSAERTVEGLTYDSRAVRPGWCFFAVVGTERDGHDYIPAAVASGAACVVCERMPERIDPACCYVMVEDTGRAMGRMAARYYGDPSRQLRLVGVTGTNGKTTTATLLHDLFRALGHKAGLISTVVYRVDCRELPSTHTTPDALRINALLREMVDAGCEYCFMEVSSHAIVQQRIAGLHFAGGIFTNITHDHLDYHKTFAAYIEAKKAFFDGLPKEAFALVNLDDRNGRVMVQNTRARVYGFSLRTAADFHCRIIETHIDGMELRLDGADIWVRLTGRFNASNIAGIYGAARLLGLERETILPALSLLQAVNGRFETITADDGTVAVVDYAHTPDALENVLETIGELRCPEQQLFVVCGCGGHRDRTKRPEMARIAVRHATTAIFTSDNPRDEDPEAIIDQMVAGLSPTDRYLRQSDRRQAIRTAVMAARPGDIILVAGKGHEDYQIIGTERRHFDDHEEVRAAFALFHQKRQTAEQ